MLNICKLTMAILFSFIASFIIILLITIALGFVSFAIEKPGEEQLHQVIDIRKDHLVF